MQLFRLYCISHPACCIEFLFIWVFFFICQVFFSLLIFTNQGCPIDASCPIASILTECDVAELTGCLLLWLGRSAILWLLQILKKLLLYLYQRLNISWRYEALIWHKVNRWRLASCDTSIFIYIIILSVITAFFVYSECLLFDVWQKCRPVALLWLVEGPALRYAAVVLKEDVVVLINLPPILKL